MPNNKTGNKKHPQPCKRSSENTFRRPFSRLAFQTPHCGYSNFVGQHLRASTVVWALPTNHAEISDGLFIDIIRGQSPRYAASLSKARAPMRRSSRIGAAIHAAGGNTSHSLFYGVFCFLAPLQETGRKYSSIVPLQDHTVLPLGLVPVPDTAKLGIR